MNRRSQAMARWRIGLIDLDGTLYRGDTMIPGADAFVTRLRESGVRPVFFTNNATRTPEQVAAKLNRMGIAADPGEVCTSAQAAAHLVRTRFGPGTYVGFIGMDGLRHALLDAGLRPLSVRDESFHARMADVRAAVLGLDTEVTYAALAGFCDLVARLGEFILTNPDVRLPVEGRFHPGNGAFGRLVAAATGVEPVVTGKPEPYFVEYALRRFGVEPDEAFIVGDNLKTDIEAGRKLGLYTVHVMTGVTYADEPDVPQPDEVCTSVAELWLNGLPY